MAEGRGSTAKDKLVTAAEELIAVRGLHGASASEVVRAAGQRNNSAIGYHFGSWDGLVAAVWARHAERINADRRARLADAPADTLDLRELVRIYVDPIAVEIGRHSPSYWARFNEQWLTGVPLNVFERPAGLQVEHDPDPQTVSALTVVFDEIMAALAHVAPARRQLRVALMARFVITALAGWERDDDVRAGTPLDVLSVQLVDLALALLLAPDTADR
jgi:AcrR family transcriptional regulator